MVRYLMNLFEIINYRHQKYSKLNKKRLQMVWVKASVQLIKGLGPGLSCHLQSCSVRDLTVPALPTFIYLFIYFVLIAKCIATL
jgi:hypothetical protein